MAKKDLEYAVDIGIECHVQLKTDTKLFCTCSNDARDARPNTTVCPVCFGMPGTLPVLNKRAVELAIRAGYVLNAEIVETNRFDRKNYFYPDLPKGYQITQYEAPIISRGEIEVPLGDTTFPVGITRAHMEEDAGKLIHPESGEYSLVDLNRAGTPLLEVVSEPDMHTPAQAKAYAQELYYRMLYADISDVDLYHGNMRFDLNVSIRPEDSGTKGTRTEIKNLNSFRNVEHAAAYEIDRQTELLRAGELVIQETRGWDEQRTYTMRTKEEADDYRYFPEPDLPPVVITRALREQALDTMPSPVTDIRARFVGADIPRTQQEALFNEPKLARLQQEVLEQTDDERTVKLITGWLSGEVVRLIRKDGFDWQQFHLQPHDLIELATMVNGDELSSTGAKEVLAELIAVDESPRDIAQRKQILQVSDTDELETMVEQAITDNPQAARDVRDGETKAIGFLTGHVMQASQGQANPQKVKELLQRKLQS